MSATITLYGEPWVELLAAVFRDVPHLPGALCVGKHELFDAYDCHQEAARLCRRCPIRAACQEWSSERHKDLTGTWAGVFYGSKRMFEDDATESEGTHK